MALLLGSSFLGIACGDPMLSGSFIPKMHASIPEHLHPQKVAKSFGITANWSTWLLQPQLGSSNALADQICALTGPCDCRSSGEAFLVVHCAMPALEALLFQHHSLVSFLEPDRAVRLQPPVEVHSKEWWWADPCGKPWGLDRIGVPQESRTGDGVHIYILDSGVNADHPDFEGRAIPTKDYTSTGCCEDLHGHGTHVTGTAIGKDNGVAKKATAHAIKVLKGDGTGKLSWTLRALWWVVEHGEMPAVLSLSLDLATTSNILDRATGAATSKGITVVVAAGNEGMDARSFSPAGASTVITVGATTIHDDEAGYSNFGPAVDIFAPGTHIVSAGNHGGQKCLSGTSMATPHVSGAAALLLEEMPTLTWEQVLRRLQDDAEKRVIHTFHEGDPPFFVRVVGATQTYGKTGPGLTRSIFTKHQMHLLLGAGTVFLGLAIAGCASCRVARRQAPRRPTGRQIELHSPVERPELPEL